MPVRIQRKRTKGWRMPPNCRCVTRPGTFGNPFATAEEFREWIVDGLYPTRVTAHEIKYVYTPRRHKIIWHLHELRGLDLECYCGPDAACHADVLLELANKEDRGE